MLLRITDAARLTQPLELLFWVLVAAIVLVVAISALVFIADCVCEWRSSSEASPRNPFCGYISRRAQARRSKLA